MFRYQSGITFLYYEDFDYGTMFMEKILKLDKVMDQGFARIYQINTNAFLGIVKTEEPRSSQVDTLVSLNTSSVEKEYQRIKNHDVLGLTDLKLISKIPLKSFFFNDLEGHRFEIQQFINKKDLNIFNIG